MSVRPIASNNQSRLAAALLAAALSLAASLPAGAQSVEEFYRKTPVQLLIGFPVANAYDTYGRAVARHLGKHIPGNPTVVPVNRPGRRQPDGGELTLQRRAEGRLDHRPLQPQHSARTVDGKFRGEVRRPQIHMARQRRQRSQRLRRLAHRRGQDLGRFPDQGIRRRRGRIGRGHRRLPDGAEEPVRRQDQDHHRLSRRRRDVDLPWSAARSTAAAAGHGAASRAASRSGSAASRSTSCCSSACRRAPSFPTSR